MTPVKRLFQQTGTAKMAACIRVARVGTEERGQRGDMFGR